MKVVQPYTSVYLSRVAMALNHIPVEDVEALLCSLILDGKINGRIDQVGHAQHEEQANQLVLRAYTAHIDLFQTTGVLILKERHVSKCGTSTQYEALARWAQALQCR
jgi:hypothetical protein